MLREGLPLTVDHVFVLCAPGAPEAEALLRLGLEEGSSNTHPGQGTACRRFFFENAYLELLWVSDSDEAQREPARSTRLWERWSRRAAGASRFGVGLRPGDEKGAPFPTRAYHPRYLPPDFAIDIAQGTPLQEPELFYLGFQRGRARPGTEPVAHALPARTLTGIAIGVPDAGALSGPARMIQDLRLVTFRTAPDHVLDLTFDRARSGGVADLRPEIPLVLSW